MNQVTLTAAIAVATCACLASSLAASDKTETWRIVELTFASSRDYANPFTEVELTATFRHGQTTIRRPAFWDGDKTWKVRFAATEPGAWQWTTACSDQANAGLHGRSGEIVCTAYQGDNPVYRHGFIKVSENRRHFVHADGTPFFWLGDTHWQMADWERLDQNNAPDAKGRGQFRQLVDDRVGKGFTVYQNYFVGHQKHWWRDDKYQCIDPSRFRAVMDPMMDHLAERGLVIAQGIGLYVTAVQVPRDSLVRLARYVSARYGAHPLVWFTAQEVNLPAGKDGQARTDLDAWAAAAEAFAKSNGYGHPVSGHMFVGQPTVWGDQPWHNWFALQGGHTGTGIRKVESFRFYWDYQPRKPFLETEAMYEQILCGPRKADDADVRNAAWKSLLCGSYGFTYGAAAVWLFKWDRADKTGDAYNPNTWWYEGMNLPGSGQMKHLRDFFAGLQWWKLTPRFADKQWCDFIDTERTVLASDDNRVFVVYAYGDRADLGSLRGLNPTADYSGQWFDPRTGQRKTISGPIRAADGSWTIPNKPDQKDWVLMIQQAPDVSRPAAASKPAG